MLLVLIMLSSTDQVKDLNLERVVDFQKVYQGGKRLYLRNELGIEKWDLQVNALERSRD